MTVILWGHYTLAIIEMDNILKKFIISLKNNSEQALTYHLTVEKISFPEAVTVAYTTKSRLGHSWRITNVRESVISTNSQNSETSGTVSLS